MMGKGLTDILMIKLKRWWNVREIDMDGSSYVWFKAMVNQKWLECMYIDKYVMSILIVTVNT